MAYIRCGSGSSGGISEIVKLTQSEYNNLATKDSNKLYLIYNPNQSIVYRAYQGATPISKYKTAQEIETYDYYFEDLCFNYDDIQSNPKVWLNSGIKLFTAENKNRNWELDFACDIDYTKTGELCLFGTSNTSYNIYEIWAEDNEPNIIGIYGYLSSTGSSDRYNYTAGQEMKIKRENGNIKVYVDGVLQNEYSKSFSEAYGDIIIGAYDGGNRYVFYGLIRYVGFKWLS